MWTLFILNGIWRSPLHPIKTLDPPSPPPRGHRFNQGMCCSTKTLLVNFFYEFLKDWLPSIKWAKIFYLFKRIRLFDSLDPKSLLEFNLQPTTLDFVNHLDWSDIAIAKLDRSLWLKMQNLISLIWNCKSLTNTLIKNKLSVCNLKDSCKS